jgi:arylsulfatase A-like enzyme
MPPASLRSRCLAAAAVVTAAGLAVTSCSSGGAASGAHQKPRHSVPSGPQPVKGISGTGLGLGKPMPAPSFHQPVEQPNLLMITVDDASWNTMKYMPHLRHLVADRGLTLRNGLAPTPICVPARASLLSGQYAHNHGAVTINGEGGGVAAFDEHRTLPVWLQKAGYRTMFVGKYLNGYGEQDAPTHVPPGWSSWHATVDPTTYNFVKPTVNSNGRTHTYHRYSTNVLSDISNRLLDRRSTRHKPWYMWVNYVAPHHGGPTAPDDPASLYPDDPNPVSTTTPARRDAGTFSWLDLNKKPDMFEKDTSDKVIIRATHDRWPAYRRNELKIAFQQRVESLQAVDRALARTFRTLHKTHQLRRTYVVFTSDNGYVLGEHNLTGKLWYFRDISGIPMYIRGPGLPRGRVSRTPVTNADWAPTFAALAGARPTRKVDGVNVMPWLTSGARARPVPIEGYPVKGGLTPLYTGIIDGPWTWVQGRSGRGELYRRTVDPYQNHNLVKDPRYQEQKRKLRKMTARYRDCAGTSGGTACPTDFYR